MALDGSAFASQAAAFAAYVEGDTPDMLTPVAGGDPVPFVHDERGLTVDPDAAGALVESTMAVFTRSALRLGRVYTWDGASWTVQSSEPDRAGGVAWPFYTILRRHAGATPGG